MIENIQAVDFIAQDIHGNPSFWRITCKDGVVVDMMDEDFKPIGEKLETVQKERMRKFWNA